MIPKREMPQMSVVIEDQKLADLQYGWMVKAAEVREAYGRLSYARLVLFNEQYRFTNDPLWAVGGKLKLLTGYPSTGLKQRLRTFIIHTPTFEFEGAGQDIVLECFSEEYLMGREQKRRSWKSMTDSGIVSQIAQDYGFTADVQTTTPTHRQVLQANESDMKFIQRRAKLYGYVVYVENGKLHFHEPRFVDSGKTLARRQDGSDFGSFKVGVNMGYRAKRVKKTQIDPLKKETFSVQSGDTPDPISKQGLSSAKGAVVKWDDLSTVGGVEEVEFLVGQGHEQEKKLAEAMVDGVAEASRWIVRGDAKIVGLEDVGVGEIITIAGVGVGRWSGQYLITEAVHRMVGGYTMELSLARTWTGKVSRSKTQGCGVGGPMYQVNRQGDVTSSLRRSMSFDQRTGVVTRNVSGR